MKDFRDWVDVAFKVVLAAVGVIVGYYFSFEKQQNEDIKLILDLVTAADEQKRTVGVEVSQEYLKQGRISHSIYISIYRFVNVSKDQPLRNQFNAGASSLSQRDETLSKEIVDANKVLPMDTLPIRIYFHIGSEKYRELAKKIQQQVQSAASDIGSLVIPGIQLVPGTRSESELRCFNQRECD